MKMFSKPKWLKPEINEPIYWFHLVILSSVVLLLLENKEAFLSIFSNFDFSLFHLFGTMFNIKNVLVSIPLLALGDLAAHTILRLN